MDAKSKKDKKKKKKGAGEWDMVVGLMFVLQVVRVCDMLDRLGCTL